MVDVLVMLWKTVHIRMVFLRRMCALLTSTQDTGSLAGSALPIPSRTPKLGGPSTKFQVLCRGVFVFDRPFEPCTLGMCWASSGCSS